LKQSFKDRFESSPAGQQRIADHYSETQVMIDKLAGGGVKNNQLETMIEERIVALPAGRRDVLRSRFNEARDEAGKPAKLDDARIGDAIEELYKSGRFGVRQETKGLKGVALELAANENVAAILKKEAYRDKWQAARKADPAITVNDWLSKEFGKDIKTNLARKDNAPVGRAPTGAPLSFVPPAGVSVPTQKGKIPHDKVSSEIQSDLAIDGGKLPKSE
jgi:hypothetical protein